MTTSLIKKKKKCAENECKKLEKVKKNVLLNRRSHLYMSTSTVLYVYIKKTRRRSRFNIINDNIYKNIIAVSQLCR